MALLPTLALLSGGCHSVDITVTQPHIISCTRAGERIEGKVKDVCRDAAWVYPEIAKRPIRISLVYSQVRWTQIVQPFHWDPEKCVGFHYDGRIWIKMTYHDWETILAHELLHHGGYEHKTTNQCTRFWRAMARLGAELRLKSYRPRKAILDNFDPAAVVGIGLF